MTLKTILATATMACIAIASPIYADNSNAFESGWTLEGSNSDLNFLSVKKGTKMELSKFATLQGEISENGEAVFKVLLDSVDTSVDLRNVRMRFLLFETFVHENAVVKTQLTATMLQELERTGVQRMKLPFSFELHGVTKAMEADVIVSLAGANQVTVASVAPLIIELADFGMIKGRDKLQETAEVTITPATAITFALTFKRNDPTVATQQLASIDSQSGSVALEPTGQLSEAACRGRFEILSRAGAIEFDYGSAGIKAESTAVLASVADIMTRCPSMVVQVSGHTDSQGRASVNHVLSHARAKSVVDYLVGLGLPSDRLKSIGYGEDRPIATNATKDGRKRNRRIEFTVLDKDDLNS